VGALAVKGTCDTLRYGHTFLVTFAKRNKCKCCGQVIRRYVLVDWGRTRLTILRKRKERRENGETSMPFMRNLNGPRGSLP
jgi:hypothetical protein